MKRLLLALVVLATIFVPVAATNDFQDIQDMQYVISPGATATWVNGGTGGNNHVKVTAAGGGTYWLQNPSASQFTYLGFTYVAANANMPVIQLYDTANTTLLYSIDISGVGRYEVDVIGSVAYVYKNGTLIGTSGALSQNPSYYHLGGWLAVPSDRMAIDDLVVGDSEDKTVLGFPEQNMYYLKKDYVNPAASGFYNTTTNTLVSSSTFTSTFSRSNLSGEALVSQPVQLVDVLTGTVYETEYTGTATTGAITWHMNNITGSAPYGWYQSKLGTTLSGQIAYIANGANIYFDEDEYAAGDTATITYLIDAGYWDSTTYDYYIRIIDVYGATTSEVAIASVSGSTTYTWTDGDTQGIYFAEIIGKPKVGGSEVLYNYDYATLSATFTIYGYVHDAETTSPISGASINASQGSTLVNVTSGFDGNYSVSGFITGTLFGMNTSSAGYQGYWNNFTPLYNHRIFLNITLLPSTPSASDVSVGGVARDTTYGRPIPSVSVDIWNTTDSEYWTVTTNIVGFYNKTTLTEDNMYNIEGMKHGYLNSTIYNKTAVIS